MKDDIPPRNQYFRSIMSWVIVSSVFLLGVFINCRQDVTTIDIQQLKSISSPEEAIHILSDGAGNDALYIKRIKNTQPVRKLFLESVLIGKVQSFYDWKKPKKLATQLIQNKEFDYVITYIQDQDGKKRTHFLL